ncbi:MAG: hypothetical protein QXZ44_03780 [Ferroplasma sp.]
MKDNKISLNRLIMVEQRYIALKDTPKFQRTVNQKNKSSYFMNNILMSYFSNSVLFTLIFALLNLVYYESGEYTLLASFGLIVFLYLFVMGIYNSISFLNSVYNNNIMSPLKSLPIDVNVNVPFSSWFIYNGSSYIFVIIPSVLFFFLLEHDYQTIFLATLYAFSVLLLSFIISSLIFIYSGKKTKKHTSIKNVIKILMLFIFFGLFYGLLEEPQYFLYLSSAITSLPYYVRLFVFPINIEYIVYLNFNISLLYRILETVLSIAFFLVLLLIYFAIRRKIYAILMTSEENSSSERITGKIATYGLMKSFLIKDFKSTFRKPQNLMYIFLPVLFVIPFFIEASSTDSALYSPFFILLFLTELVVSFYSIFLLVIEGKGIEILNSLPVSKRSIANYKSVFGLIIFTVLVIIYITVTAAINRKIEPVYLIYLIDVISLFYVILYFNIARLMKKIAPGSSNINYYSFGTYPMLMIFIYSIILMGISVAGGLALSYLLLHTSYDYAYFIFPINILLFFFIVYRQQFLPNNENVINSL